MSWWSAKAGEPQRIVSKGVVLSIADGERETTGWKRY